MKRIQEKIKDLVEHNPLHFTPNPTETLEQTFASYRFTDATSTLMSKWIDAIADGTTRSGLTRALAGHRGVGKSHFLGLFGVLLSNPEFRNKITDSHVAAGTQRLQRRKFSVVRVQRGTDETLLNELKTAMMVDLQFPESSWQENLGATMAIATAQLSTSPLVILIDSAYGRASRIKRDDGVLLGELAEIAKSLNIFVAVALDDDIAGADGVNAAIARTYTIDYLDPEHLYRIIDSHIFPKKLTGRATLHNIYLALRETMFGFNWSEPRFTSLYPIHPAVVDIASMVRLYAPSFSFLPFAAEAGSRALNRPAHSLIALDEVFDRAEHDLRKSEELTEAFVNYDKLTTEAIGQIPIMQRLQAKLVLKGLFIFSLDGRGVTPQELSAAMLIYDENQPETAVQNVASMLERFSAALPEGISRKDSDDGILRYSLNISNKANFDNTLAEAAQTIEDASIEKVMHRIARSRFGDWNVADHSSEYSTDLATCQITWRGILRTGRLVWNWRSNDIDAFLDESLREKSVDNSEWEVVIVAPDSAVTAVENQNIPVALWQPSAIRTEEEKIIRRYVALISLNELTEEFGEVAEAAKQTHAAQIERIWSRIFLDEGNLLIDGEAVKFTEEALNAATFTDTLSLMLESLFDRRYPAHPHFPAPLGMNEVSQMVNDLFGGANQNDPEVQRLAHNFALPLGLVTPRGNILTLETEDHISSVEWVQKVLALVNAADGETIPLSEVYNTLKAMPFGLAREAQHLILAALVAQRRIEFVTASGDRISRRSLNLKIIWDDVVGIARPSSLLHSATELTKWAQSLTGIKDFQSIDDAVDREKVRTELRNWLEDWQTQAVLESFDALPDEVLNTRNWRLAARIRRSFGTTAESIEAVLSGSISLEEGLQRVADSFLDSFEQFEAAKQELASLLTFVKGTKLRQTVRNYILSAEITDDAVIEHLRREVLTILHDQNSIFDAAKQEQLEEFWEDFHDKFTEFFALRHDAVMKSNQLRQQIQQITGSAEWREFENLSALPAFPTAAWNESVKLLRQNDELNCPFEVRQLLEQRPSCACSFRLSKVESWRTLPNQMVEQLNLALSINRRTLRALSPQIKAWLDNFAQTETNLTFVERARFLSNTFAGGGNLPVLNGVDLKLIKQALSELSGPALIRAKLPKTMDGLSRENLRVQFNQWLDGLPGEPAQIKLVSENEN